MSVATSFTPPQIRHPGLAGLTILLYAPDEGLARKLEALLAPHAQVRWENSRTIPVVTLMSGERPWQIVLLDFSIDNSRHSTDLARQIALHDPALPLVAIGSPHRDGAHSVLSAMRAGVRDFIDIEASTQEMLSVLRKSMVAGAPPLHAMPTAGAVVEHDKGRNIVLLGVRGGVGCSTLAAHLAALASPAPATPAAATKAEPQEKPNHSLVIDLGVPTADSALYLDVHAEFHFGAALSAAERFDATLARTTLPRHASGAAVLSRQPGAVPDPSANPTIDALITRLGRIFKVVLCDTGGLPATLIPVDILHRADEIWLVTDTSVSAMIALGLTMDALERIGIHDPHTASSRLHLVVNRFIDDGGITPTQVSRRFTLPLIATLPERGQQMRATSNLGLLLHDRQPRDPYIKALQPLLARLQSNPAASPPPSTTGRWLAGLKALPWTRTT